MSRTITSADGTFILSSADIALAATEIGGWAADAAWAFDNVNMAETILGVDGKLSAGWVPRAYQMTVTIMPDSDAIEVFNAFQLACDASKTVYRLNGVLTLPGLGRSFMMTRGVLQNYTPVPTGQKVLQAQTFQIMWEGVKPVPIA